MANPSDWVREILESGDPPDHTLNREREILQALDARSDPMSYNDTNAESGFVGATSGKICITDDVNEKFVSEKLLDGWLSLGWKRGRSTSNKQRIGSTVSKRRTDSPEEWTSLTGASNNMAKKYKFTSPDGKEFFVHGEFRKFCLENKISANTMIKAMKEGWIPRRGSCDGWKVENLTTGKSTNRDTLNYGSSHSGENNPYYGGKKKNSINITK